MSKHIGARPRPAVHFTVRRGWTNDPHGIVHVDGAYHMFFQYNPHATQSSPACQWGQARSDDLIEWHEEARPALTPEAGEAGCWSGSAVVDERGPVLIYTRVVAEAWDRGQVALARPRHGMTGWRRTPPHAVIPGPPEGLPVIAFRDPYVWGEAGSWRAILGGGLSDGLRGGGGCALQYRSADLHTWTFDGVLAQRDAGLDDPVRTGTVWECPQFFNLDGSWVLLVSVWEDHELHHVAYAVGDYDGSRFRPRTWGRLSHGDQLYATTTFLDADGRRCVMSWLRERQNRAPDGSPWASAMSLPHVLALDGEQLVARQHPALDGYFPDRRTIRAIGAGEHVEFPALPAAWRLVLDSPVARGGRLVIATGTWELRLTASSGVEVVGASGEPLLSMPSAGTGGGRLDVVADADILEVTWAGSDGVAAVRVPPAAGSRLRLHCEGAVTANDVCHGRPADPRGE